MKYPEAIKKTKDYNVIIATGDEEFFRNQITLKVLSDLPESELIRLDCAEIPESDIFSEIYATDLFNTKRIYLLSNFLKLKKLDILLEDEVPNKIILDSEKEGKSKIFEQLKKKFLHIECPKPKIWEEKQYVMALIDSFFNKRAYSIVSAASEYIYTQVGGDLFRLFNELQKIIYYKDTPSKIYLEDVQKVCAEGVRYNIYEIMDKLLDTEKKEALILLDNLFKYESSPGILLISLWYTHFEYLLLIKTSTKGDSDLIKYVKTAPFIISKKLRPQASKLSVKKIVQSLNYLVCKDFEIRQGSFNIKLYLEKFILDF